MLYTFSHYYLTTHIGRRASRDIYLSYPMGEPEHKVILKLYDPECQVPGTYAEDFLFTSRRFKQLAHPHLIPIIDIGLQEGKPYVVSDYIANGSLRQQREQRPANRLNLDEALRIIQDIGTAIVYAHAHTIIHKDIRPENILFNEPGEALLGDFVLREIIQERGIQHQFDIRTLNYMAPEQFSGISTPPSDQYALGCLLYELITGSLPFGAGTGSLFDQQLTAEPTPPSAIVAGIPKAVETTILQALSHQQGERYPDVETFLSNLQTATRPAPPVFPFARSLSQPSTANAPTGATDIQIRSTAGLLAPQPAEETKHEDTSQQITEQENTEDAEDEEAENEGANDQVAEQGDQVMAADQDAEDEEEEDQYQVSPFFDIIMDPVDETEEEDTQSTASSGRVQNTPSAPGSGSPGIPSPRVMFPLMKKYSEQQDDTPAVGDLQALQAGAGDDQDDPFAYSSTPVSAAQPEDKALDLRPKAEALILPANPVQQEQLAVLNQQSWLAAPTAPPQSSRSYTIQPLSRQRNNSFLLIALVSIILATILSTSFNAAILAMTDTLPATASALALKQTGTQGIRTSTTTTSTQPTPSGSKKNPGSPKSNPKRGAKPTRTGGSKGSSQPPVGTSNGGQSGGVTLAPPPSPPSPTPTASPTRTGSGFNHGVSSIGSGQTQFWFQPSGWTADYVILHYIVSGQTPQNMNMTYDSSTARWEYNVGGLSAGQTVTYSFTYQQGGLQYNTGEYTVGSSPPTTPVTCTGNFNQAASSAGSTQAQFSFQPCGWTADYVILHYTITGQTPQNMNMAYNSSSGQWTYTAGGVSAGQTVTYSFTYQQGGLQYNTGTYTWTHP